MWPCEQINKPFTFFGYHHSVAMFGREASSPSCEDYPPSLSRLSNVATSLQSTLLLVLCSYCPAQCHHALSMHPSVRIRREAGGLRRESVILVNCALTDLKKFLKFLYAHRTHSGKTQFHPECRLPIRRESYRADRGFLVFQDSPAPTALRDSLWPIEEV